MRRNDILEQANAIKAGIVVKEEKATDLDVIVAEIMKLPHGQLKKVLTAEVMAVLEKYGYGEEAA